ncbi:hypothetical protein [Streptomyces sp. NPDC054866]
MRLQAHQPDARASCAVLLYEGDAVWPDAYRHRPGYRGEDDVSSYYRARRTRDRYEPERREREQARARPEGESRERVRERERLEREQRARRERRRGSAGPPLATRAVRDALTRPDGLFHSAPDRVTVLGSGSSQSAYTLPTVIAGAHDLLFFHYTGGLDTGDPFGLDYGRNGMPFLDLFDVIESTPARHIVVVLEPDRPTEVPPAEALRPRYEQLMRRFEGRLTLIVADPDPRSPRPFLAEALGARGPLSVRTLAVHPRAQLLMRAKGRDIRLTGAVRSGGRRPMLRNHVPALTRIRPALTKARESTASVLSAVAPFALLLLAVAVVAGGLFGLLRALPPMRGTWGAAALLGLWAVLAVIGIVGARLRTPPARARPPGTASPAPRSRAFMDGMWTAWGLAGPPAGTAGRPRQPIPPRPTREESRAAVERSLNALYARLPVPQMRAPDPPTSPASPSSPSPSPSPDDNGTTP